MMRVAVIGTGYVGLVSGACLAAKGHDVTCVDINQNIVDRLNAGNPHIHEEGLPELLADILHKKLFRATTSLREALDRSEIVILAVGTPSEDGVIDLKYVRAAAAQIGQWLRTANRFVPVIVKSTVVPGTTDTVVRQELESNSGLELGAFGLGMNPEFLREGEAVDDFMHPDRIVMGYEDQATLAALQKLYAPWDCEKLAVPTRTAEMIKYANNAILAVQISAMNELANVAARLGGIDMLDVVHGVQLDKRWSPIVAGERITPGIVSYLLPGCGFGGSCFPKDVQAIRSLGEAKGLPMQMLNAVLAVNASQPGEVRRVLQANTNELENKKVLVLGLAFKPGTDDVRETASLPIIRDLLNAGAQVTAHDPIAVDGFKALIGSAGEAIRYADDWRSVVDEQDIIVIVTRWEEYRSIAGRLSDCQILFDVRRLLTPSDAGAARYLSIGRGDNGTSV